MSNEKNALPFPPEVLKNVLPNEGDTVKLGEASFSKIEYQGKAYVLHWSTGVHILAAAGFDDLEKETALINERKTALDGLIGKFNELKATPVK